jgi:large subunit ribosomal protein L17
MKRFADKFITLAKEGTAHARRIAHRDVRDVEVLNKLFDTLGPRFKDRAGGYTRIVRVGRRAGDAAEMAMIELVDRAPAGGAGEKAEGAEKKPAAKGKKAKGGEAEKAAE